jgi:hypothetical protein
VPTEPISAGMSALLQRDGTERRLRGRVYQRRNMGITARDIYEPGEFIVKDSIRIIRYRNTLYDGHFRRIENVDGIRFAARHEGKMTRRFDDNTVCSGLAGQSRYVSGRRQSVFMDLDSIHISGGFIRDEQLVTPHR